MDLVLYPSDEVTVTVRQIMEWTERGFDLGKQAGISEAINPHRDLNYKWEESDDHTELLADLSAILCPVVPDSP